MWLLPIQKNEAIIYKTYNINSLSYTLLPLMVRKEHRQMLSFVVSNLFEIINHFIVIRNIPSMPQMDL